MTNTHSGKNPGKSVPAPKKAERYLDESRHEGGSNHPHKRRGT